MWRFISVTIFILAAFAQTSENPPYIKQCSRSDPQLLDCLRDALHHLRPYLATGIPEIEVISMSCAKISATALFFWPPAKKKYTQTRYHGWDTVTN
uniref:Putative hemolymph juvenile hormone binding protein n=1 Tax=Lutzomyia longipalpis TaxID=7200 RepID=A0A1B0CVW5_LUTLO